MAAQEEVEVVDSAAAEEVEVVDAEVVVGEAVAEAEAAVVAAQADVAVAATIRINLEVSATGAETPGPPIPVRSL